MTVQIDPDAVLRDMEDHALKDGETLACFAMSRSFARAAAARWVGMFNEYASPPVTEDQLFDAIARGSMRVCGIPIRLLEGDADRMLVQCVRNPR